MIMSMYGVVEYSRSKFTAATAANAATAAESLDVSSF
jgi:hypothetical protein